MNKEEERNDRNLDIHKEREYWEAYLKDYEDVILYVQGILLLRRPISFVFLSLTVFFLHEVGHTIRNISLFVPHCIPYPKLVVRDRRDPILISFNDS
jgi:hypothetical protein